MGNSNSIAEDCGHFFEVGFTIGMLTYIHQHEKDFIHHLSSIYQDNLCELQFPAMVKSALRRGKVSPAQHKRLIIEQWFMFFLQRGFLAGLNFLREYLESLHWRPDDEKIELAYYQSSFCDANSINTIIKNSGEEQRTILSQLSDYGIAPESVDIQKYSRKGRFLNADALLLLRHEDRWRLLCIDLSIFSVTSPSNLRDPNDIHNIRQMLLSELAYVRSKSVFTNLSINTASNTPGFTLSRGLETYFTAFKHGDKESAKLIQAGSYAYDFYTFLIERGILSEHDAITFNIVGYTDRNVCAMSVNQERLALLQTCANIYRHDPGSEEIHQARLRVLNTICDNAAYSFKEGEVFTGNIVGVVNNQDGVHWIPTYRECEEDFVAFRDPLPRELVTTDILNRLGQQEINLLDAHGTLVTQELSVENKRPLLFLTGNPGIGKTTAIVNFLKDHQDEGFLFFYISPRKQVNLDIVNKFRLLQGGSLSGDIFAVTSNSTIIHANGKPTVHYYAARRRGDFQKQGIKTTIDFKDAENPDLRLFFKHLYRLEQLSDQRIWDRGRQTSGVLDCICNALYIGIHEKLSNQLVATVAIQSLKKTSGGGDTLKHLEKIFLDAYNSRSSNVLPQKMQEIAARIKHIFIMIDEITGDESGVAFLEGINNFIKKYELTRHGFNTKIIVADASIVDRRVIARHLKESTYEPDKIYFQHVPSAKKLEPLTREEFSFKEKDDAVVINANAYPARRLHLRYNVCTEFLKYDEETFLQAKDRLTDAVQQKMVEDLQGLLKHPDIRQVIVYIQDKRRLSKFIAQLRKIYGSFEKKIDYLEIHANISESDKNDIQDCKSNVRVIFMTASASRGLSFPDTTHILVDIPRFEVEQNLMEIIQVIYRGRGDEEMDKKEKELLFYLSDRAVYYEDGDREISLRESTLNLLNILLILKTSIMTRIAGHGQIGRQHFMIIPIGGKSVLAAGETYVGKMERLIGDLKREYDKPGTKDVYEGLQELLAQADMRLRAETQAKGNRQTAAASYLSIRSAFSSRFADAVYNGFHKLLEWEPLAQGYISGSLLVVHTEGKKLLEYYQMHLEDKLRTIQGSDLWKNMRRMCVSSEYTENLQSAMKDALELIDILNQAPSEKIQNLTQDSQNPDQYYALPLIAFMQSKMIENYYADNNYDQDGLSFRSLLATYIRTLYPVSGILPIGDNYGEFPYVIFRSFNLKEARNKLFSDSHVLISNEMNVLNMLLSYRD